MKVADADSAACAAEHDNQGRPKNVLALTGMMDYWIAIVVVAVTPRGTGSAR